MHCSVVFGVTLRLLVINISSFSPAINTAAYYQRCVTTCGGTVAVVHRRPCWQHLACCSLNGRSSNQIASESRFLPTDLHSTAPLGRFPSEYCHAVWYGKTRMVWLPDGEKKLRRYLYSFWQNVRTWQTDRRTDTAWRHRPEYAAWLTFTFPQLFAVAETLKPIMLLWHSFLIIIIINIKNFLRSLTTVVRAQNDTSKTANITYTISIEHWYSPYKRRRFENRSDQSTWQGQAACCQISASYNGKPMGNTYSHNCMMHHAVMPICISHRLTIICAQKWGFSGFEGEDVKILCCDPQKALPCVNTRLLMYRTSKSVQRPEL